MGTSNDAGGDIYVTPDPMSSSCNFDSGSVSYYGNFLAGTTYSAVLPNGAYVAHYAFDVYVNAVLVDIGSESWSNGAKMYASFTTTGQT